MKESNKSLIKSFIGGAILVSIVSVGMYSCTEWNKQDPAVKRIDNSINDVFIPIGDTYKIGNELYDVYYDKYTNIVYLESNYQRGGNATQLIGPDKLPIKLNEYNKIYHNK